MAELYEELKNRVSQFNMHVEPRRPVMDQEYTYKQRFILQVRWGRGTSVLILSLRPPPWRRKCPAFFLMRIRP